MRKFFTRSDPVLPMHHPNVLVREAIAQGADEHALLSGTGITPPMLTSSEARISYEQYDLLIEHALRLTHNPALGLDYGRSLHLSHLGVLGLLLMSSSSAVDAIQAGLKYYKTLAPAWDLNVHIEGDVALLSAREAICRGPHLVFATEALMLAIYGFAKQLLPDFGRAVREVQLAFPAPAHAPLYNKEFEGPIRFGCEQTRVLMDVQTLMRPLASADSMTATWAERECAALSSSSALPQGLVVQVEALLSKSRGEYPDLEKLARLLQTSKRSLRRSLQAMGTSYQELLDQVRCKQAIECVSTTDLSCESIARQLAFSSARSFRRAFQRWTGMTPAEYRAPRRRVA